jgi:hypothetical protein
MSYNILIANADINDTTERMNGHQVLYPKEIIFFTSCCLTYLLILYLELYLRIS